MVKVEALPEHSEEPKEIIVRVRKCFGVKGGANYYYHADVLVKNEEEALTAANEGRIINWRWIDTFDTSDKNYRNFVLLGEISQAQAENLRRPLTREELEEIKNRNERSKAVRKRG